MRKTLNKLFFKGAVSLGLAFAAVSARAEEEAVCIADSAVTPVPDTFNQAVSDLHAFRQAKEGGGTAALDPAVALEGARLRLAVAESTTLQHLQEGRTTLKEYEALLTATAKHLAVAELPQVKGKTPAPHQTQALRHRLREAGEGRYLLRAQYNLHLIDSMYPPQPGIINEQTFGQLEGMAQQVRTAVATLREKTPRRSEGDKVLAELGQRLPAVHFAVAAVAVTYLTNKTLGYGQAQTLNGLCSTKSHAEMESRARMLATVVRDNMKKGSSGYIAFGFVDQNLPNDSTDAVVEASAKRGFESMVSSLIADIRGLQGCGVPRVGSAAPSAPFPSP